MDLEQCASDDRSHDHRGSHNGRKNAKRFPFHKRIGLARDFTRNNNPLHRLACRKEREADKEQGQYI